MANTTEIEITRRVLVSDQDIDDIMGTALDCGISYWCCRCDVYGDKYLGEFASDQISRGGSLIFYDRESDDQWSMNRGDFMNGLKQYLESSFEAAEIIDSDGKIDCCGVDAAIADSIVQYALFGKLIFG